MGHGRGAQAVEHPSDPIKPRGAHLLRLSISQLSRPYHRGQGRPIRDGPRLRVAVVTRFYDPYPSGGGAEIQAARLARYVAGAHGSCEVVTTRFGADSPSHEMDDGVSVRRLPTGAGRLSRPIEFIAAFWYVFANGRRIRVVHAFCLSAFTLGAVMGARVRGICTIALPCTIGPDGDIARLRRPLVGRLLWRLFCSVDVMVARTRAVAHELEANGIHATKIVRLPGMLETAPDRPLDPGERRTERARLGLPDRPIVLYAGRLVEAKGVPLILQAWPEIRARRDATLLIVGDGPLRSKVASVAAAFGAADEIRVVGRQPDLRALFRAADIFVMPSLSEVFGSAVAEAMGYGLAIVTTRTGLAADWMRDGRDGVVIPHADRAQLVEAIDSLLGDEPRRRSLGIEAHRKASEAFAPRVVGEAHLALYRRLLDGTGVRQEAEHLQ